MENASKALIIAGAILISILLISVGILIFNSTSGVTDSAGEAGDAMMIAAVKENVKIILGTMDIEDDEAFNRYICSKYVGCDLSELTDSSKRKLTEQEVVELCTLVGERTMKLAGSYYEITETHISSSSDADYRVLYYDKDNNEITFIKKCDAYYATMRGGPGTVNYDGNYSISIKEWGK